MLYQTAGGQNPRDYLKDINCIMKVRIEKVCFKEAAFLQKEGSIQKQNVFSHYLEHLFILQSNS